MRTRTRNFIAYTLAIPFFIGAERMGSAQSTTPLYDPGPTYAGFQLPHVAGSLRYSLTASETTGIGNISNDSAYQTYFSGNTGYISRSTLRPFSMIYSAGVSVGGSSQASRVFQNLAFSQSLALKHWTLLVTDSFSYLPSSPVPGLSGVAGIGDVGAGPFQTGISSGDGLQSNSSTRLSNAASGIISRSLTGRTSLNVSGSFAILRFLGSNGGLESNSGSGTVGLSHALSVRTSFGGSYFYSRSAYAISSVKTTTQGANLNLSHHWSARLSSEFSGGPVYVQSTGAPGSASVDFSASTVYVRGQNNFSFLIGHRTNTGSGVTFASRATDLSGSLSRKLGRFSNASATVSYIHSTVLPSVISVPYTISGVAGSVQLSRSLSRTLSTYASYTVRQQDVPSNGFSVNALQGTQQTVGFGLTYSPRPITIGRQ